MAKDPYLCTPTPRLPRRRRHGCVITARCVQHPEGAVRVSDVRARQAKLRQLTRQVARHPDDELDEQAEDAVVTMYRELLAARDQGREPPGSGAEGRWAFEMILGIYQSHREGGRRIDLPMPERRHPLEVWREETQ